MASRICLSLFIVLKATAAVTLTIFFLKLLLGKTHKTERERPVVFHGKPEEASLLYPWLGLFVKQKSLPPWGGRDCSDVFGGERGIRTPGPTIAGQRFSRPPHSTALPFLPSSAVASAKAEFVRPSFSEGGIRPP